MVPPLVTAQVVKWALQNLSNVKRSDVQSVVKQFQRATRGYSWMPGVGGFGIGLAVGAGVGLLFAPRAGAETREAVQDYLRARLNELGTKPAASTSATPPGGVGSASGNGAAESESRSV